MGGCATKEEIENLPKLLFGNVPIESTASQYKGYFIIVVSFPPPCITLFFYIVQSFQQQWQRDIKTYWYLSYLEPRWDEELKKETEKRPGSSDENRKLFRPKKIYKKGGRRSAPEVGSIYLGWLPFLCSFLYFLLSKKAVLLRNLILTKGTASTTTATTSVVAAAGVPSRLDGGW